MSVYNRKHSFEEYCPKVENDTFLNEAVAGDGTPNELIALIDASGYCPLVPGNPAIENLPIVHPERNDEEVRQDGAGLGVSEVYDLGWSDGAASKMSKCIFGLHIKDTLGKILAAGITGTVAEVSTVLLVADVAKSLQNKYFRFDVVDADGDNPLIKYHVWFNVGGLGVDPNPDGSTAIVVAITENDTAATIAGLTATAIDAQDDCTCPAPGAATITITNDTLGAVDNTHDVDAGVTCTTTVDGVTKKVISESTTLPNIAFHDEKEATGEDIRIDILGVTQLEYIWSCEEKGKLEEERGYLVAWFMDNETNTVLDLAKPRGPDGTQWLTQHPFSKYKKNLEWGSFKDRITFKYNGDDVECKITSISIKASIEVDYKRDDGSSYSNAREIKARNYEITMTIRPTGSMLRSINKLHYSAYAGAITLTAKAQRGDDTNDYQQWDFTKLRLLPIPQDLLIEPYYEEFDIVLHAAPANVTEVEILGYLSQQYYGVN